MVDDLDAGRVWSPLSEEERTRHHALFYCQGPIEGMLPGEKARELFLKSNLPLPVLSQIWNLVDNPHDNTLDASEFAVAMHLIQSKLLGKVLPASLPECLQPVPLPEADLPSVNKHQMAAYRRLFEVLDQHSRGFLTADLICRVMKTSGLKDDALAVMWNLADVDRDGNMTVDEFAVACHLILLFKQGITVSGPVNVQSLLPHKMPKYDLQAKRKKLQELEARKQKLMALKERRKTEGDREKRRAALGKEKLKLMKLKHQVLRENNLDTDGDNTFGEILLHETQKVAHLEAVAHRLKREYEKVRQETARSIMEEQRVAKEVKSLEEEADQLRKKRQRNSLIKDLDPFHELHEQRKEERLKGIRPQRKDPDLHIPQKADPFDKASLISPPMSGQDVFGGKGSDAWPGQPADDLLELTQGFEDNFVDVWSQSGKNANSFWDKDKDFIFEDEDPVFKTVPVTAEEDELWCSLPPVLLTNQSEDLQSLQTRLAAMTEQAKVLHEEAEQLVFRDAAEYEVPVDEAATQRRASEGHVFCRQSSDGGRRKSHDLQYHHRELSPLAARDKNSEAVESCKTLQDYSSNSHSIGVQDSAKDANDPTAKTQDVKLDTESQSVKNQSPCLDSPNGALKIHDISSVSPGRASNGPSSDEPSNSHSVTASGAHTTQSQGRSEVESLNCVQKQNSPQVRSVKRRSLSRERAIVDDPEYYISESISSIIPKTDSVDFYVNIPGLQSHKIVSSLEERLNEQDNGDIRHKQKLSLVSSDNNSNLIYSDVAQVDLGKEPAEKFGTFPDTYNLDNNNKPEKVLHQSSSSSVSEGATTAENKDFPFENGALSSEKPVPPPRSPAKRASAKKKLGKSPVPEPGYVDSGISSCPISPPRRHKTRSPGENQRPRSLPPGVLELVSRSPPKPPRTSRAVSPPLSEASTTSPILRRLGSPQLSTPSSSAPSSNFSTPAPSPVPQRPPRKNSKKRSSLPPQYTSPESSRTSTPELQRSTPPTPRQKGEIKGDLKSNERLSKGLESLKSYALPQPFLPAFQKTESELNESISSQKSSDLNESFSSPRQTLSTADVSSDQSDTPVPPPRVKRRSKKVKLIETRFKHKSVDVPISGRPSSPTSSKRHSLPVETAELKIHSDAATNEESGLSKLDTPGNRQSLPVDLSEYELVFGESEQVFIKQSENSENLETAENIYENVSVRLPQLGAEEEDSNMDPESRRQELENLRAHFFGYKDGPSSPPSSPPWQSREQSLNGNFPASQRQQNSMLVNIGSDDNNENTYENVQFQQGKSVVTIKNDSPRPNKDTRSAMSQMNTSSVSGSRKSKVVLSFGQDGQDNTYNASMNEPIYSSIDLKNNKDSHIYTQLDLSDGGGKTVKNSRQPGGPHTSRIKLDYDTESPYENYSFQTNTKGHAESNQSAKSPPSRIVLDLDSHQYVPEVKMDSNKMHNPNSGMTAEEEFMLRDKRAAQRPSATNKSDTFFHGGSTKINVSSDDQEQDSYLSSRSGSYYPGRVNTSDLDIMDMPRSEMSGQTDDSDLSENETSFHATFTPNLNDTSLDDTDSGITLVSFNHRSVVDGGSSEGMTSPRDSDATRPSSASSSGFPRTIDRSDSPGFDSVEEDNIILTKMTKLEMKPETNLIPDAPPPLPFTPPPTFPTPPPAFGDEHHHRTHYVGTAESRAFEAGKSPGTVNIAVVDNFQDKPVGLISSWAHTTPATTGASSPESPPVQPMDPRTGLRKTGYISPVDQAALFVDRATEPSFRVRKKDEAESEEKLAKMADERQEILDQMKVRRRHMANWVPGMPLTSEEEHMTESQKKYLERKQHVPADVKPVQLTMKPTQVTMKPIQNVKPRKPGDIDARSIADQDRMKQHWEGVLSSGEVSLFPRPLEPVKRPEFIGEFKSEVEEESIADLSSTKLQWEQKAAELAKEEERTWKPQKSKHIDIKSPVNNNNIYDLQSPPKEDTEYESAIEREIRLAQEREADLRREKESRLHSPPAPKQDLEKEVTMPIHKVPPPSAGMVMYTKSPTTPSRETIPTPISSSFEELPEADRGSDMQKPESIIEKEIREQQEREDLLKHEGKLSRQAAGNKEQEQSEYERQEKEQERINAHESIIDREIRLQRERELDFLSRQRAHYTSSGLSDITTTTEDSEFVAPRLLTSPLPRKPSPARHPVIVAEPRRDMMSNHTSHQQVQVVDGNNVTYEEAISTSAHPGESRIARELREQREREDELRKRWQEIGLESPFVPSEPDTPYNMPEPRQRSYNIGPSNTSMYQKEIKPSKDKLSTVQHLDRSSADSGASGKSVGYVDGATHASRKTLLSSSDDSEDTVVSSSFDNQHETPIEREIRLSREREEELRRQKGLPVADNKPAEQFLVEVRSSSPVRRPVRLYHKGQDEDEKGTMKRLASSRLQQEIESEKKREVMLRQEGKISTTSEERVGPTKRYVEVISSTDATSPPDYSGAKTPVTPKSPKTPNYGRPLVSPVNAATVQGSQVKQPPPQSKPAPPIAEINVVKSPENKSAPPLQNGGMNHTHSQPAPSSSEPTMAKRVTGSASNEKFMVRRSQNPAESKIEQEMREMREREEELRQQREILAGRPYLPPPAEVQANGGEQYQEEEVRPRIKAPTTIPGDSVAKTPRRKSALAEEWERRIGGNA